MCGNKANSFLHNKAVPAAPQFPSCQVVVPYFMRRELWDVRPT
ncbi:MAG: hypothetical protein ACXVDB_09890 [Tumebacillaceae bacterium]